MKQYLLIITILTLAFQTTAQSFQDANIDYAKFRSAMKLKRDQAYDQAIADFSTFIDDYPLQYSRAYYYRGYSFFYTGEYDKALDDFLMLCKLEKKDPVAFYAVGKTYATIGKYKAAIEYFTKAINKDAFYTHAYNERGMAYCNMNMFNPAIKDFLSVVRIDSSFAMGYNNIGAARYFNQDVAVPTKSDMRQAIKWFTKAIEKNDKLFDPYYNRAAMYYFSGEYDLAAKDLTKATAINPNSALCHFYFGMVYNKKQQYGRATAEYQWALQLNPALKFAYEEIGNMHKEQGDFQTAIEYYEQAKTVGTTKKENQYIGLMNYRIAVAHALLKNEENMYDALKIARSNKVFKDKKVYQEFLRDKAFKKFRAKKDFRKFAKSIRGGKKHNKFLSAELSWFRMTL